MGKRGEKTNTTGISKKKDRSWRRIVRKADNPLRAKGSVPRGGYGKNGQLKFCTGKGRKVDSEGKGDHRLMFFQVKETHS